MDNLVIATGGGVVTDIENTEKLKSNGFVIWLYADADIIRERLNNDVSSAQSRPSLTGEDPSDEILRVLMERKPLYENAGDFAVDTGKPGIDEVVDVIIAEIESRGQRAEVRDQKGKNNAEPQRRKGTLRKTFFSYFKIKTF